MPNLVRGCQHEKRQNNTIDIFNNDHSGYAAAVYNAKE